MAKKTYKIELSDVEKFYILGNYSEDSVALAEKFDKPLKLIEEFKAANVPAPKEEYIHQPKAPTSSDLMAKRLTSINGQRVGSVILTQAASEMIDTKRNASVSKPSAEYITKAK